MSAHEAMSPLEHFRSYLHLLAALRAEAEALTEGEGAATQR